MDLGLKRRSHRYFCNELNRYFECKFIPIKVTYYLKFQDSFIAIDSYTVVKQRKKKFVYQRFQRKKLYLLLEIIKTNVCKKQAHPSPKGF